jgi:hypothetical protein
MNFTGIVRGMISLLSLAILLFLILPLFFNFNALAQEDNSLVAGKKRLQKISDEIAQRAKVTGGQRNIYPVPADALEESRGEKEDRLRMYLLALFPPGETRKKIKDIINRPWDDDTVRDLWEANYSKRGGQEPTGEIFHLIIYAAKKYDGQVFVEVKSKLNDLFDKFNDPNWRPTNHKMGALLISALRQYGTPDILPDSFWKQIENEKNGPQLLIVLWKVGDKDTLVWLEDFQKRCSWQEKRSLQKLSNAIQEIRARILDPNNSDQRKVEQGRTGQEKKGIPEQGAANEFDAIQCKKMERMRELLFQVQRSLANNKKDGAIKNWNELVQLYGEVEMGKITVRKYRNQMLETWKVAQEETVANLPGI